MSEVGPDEALAHSVDEDTSEITPARRVISE